MRQVGFPLAAIVLMLIVLAGAQEPDSQPASQPLNDAPTSATLVRELVVDLATGKAQEDGGGPAEFTAAMTAASQDLSDAEYGAYARLLIGNMVGETLPEKYENAYDQSLANAHAMQGAALVLLQQEMAKRMEAVAETQAKINLVMGEFSAYIPAE
ncbi:MAG TPA: hypothetical protein PKM73_14510 [Verrucomicrobiota bacterium]|nr:hypothetical protein [Verrucomicrobiota bacterium]